MKNILKLYLLLALATVANAQTPVIGPPALEGVVSINLTSGAFTFTGSGVSCSGTTCTFSGAPSGTAGGDLTGTYPNPTVKGLEGNALPALTSGYLNWTGTAWALSAPGSGNVLLNPSGAQIITQPVNTNFTVAGSGTGVADFSGMPQFKLPVVAGYVPTASGECGHDSTSHNLLCYDNAVSNFIALFPTATPPTSGHVAGFLQTGSTWTLNDLGAPPTSLPPSGAAGGDLSGTYPNPTVKGTNGLALPVSASILATNSSGQVVSNSSVSKAAAGDLACAAAGDTTIGSNAITAGTSTSLTGTALSVGFFPAGTLIGVTGATPGGLNGGPYATSVATTSGSTLTFANGTLPATWVSGGTIFLWCENQVTDAIASSAPQYFSNAVTVNAVSTTFPSWPTNGVPLVNTAHFSVFSSSAPPGVIVQHKIGTSGAGTNLYSTTTSTGVVPIVSLAGSTATFQVEDAPLGSGTLVDSDAVGMPVFPTLAAQYGNTFNNTHKSPTAFPAGSQTLSWSAYWIPTGVASGTYTSGITTVGTVGQTCTLTSFNNSSTATATVALTGTNTIASGTALVITARGQSATAAPTSATAGTGTATSCSGTAVISTVLGGALGNALMLNQLVARQY